MNKLVFLIFIFCTVSLKTQATVSVTGVLVAENKFVYKDASQTHLIYTNSFYKSGHRCMPYKRKFRAKYTEVFFGGLNRLSSQQPLVFIPYLVSGRYSPMCSSYGCTKGKRGPPLL